MTIATPMFCSHCGTELLKSAKFCAACGRPVDIGSAATLLGSEDETLAASTPGRTPAPASGPPKPSSSGSSLLSSSGPIGGGRFAPGTILAGRYRIVALAGRGGMGEVYRADDLKLGQTVAIKFLPEALTHDPSALERFHSEVRLARHVSHPNVCRVFDIGESEGVTYLTMEYVDGEDLGSLIRRIGRFSPDKAIEIARQICAGLAAAHDRGVIHRDLKPANVMLDGQGKVRITDFGLAGIAESIQGAEIRAGTPVYMAPEQLAGKEVTFKSDLYALGLILYELVTGKRAYEAATFQELMKLREQSTPTNPSALVKDLDPLAERVILRCLERDPAKRPSSAIQVAAALPGGDPLAAALAAGETPSPQMVAAAGESTGFSPRAAVACLAAVLAGLVLVVFLAVNESGLERMHLENPPDVLAQKAREVVNALGYTERPEDRAFGFSYDTNFLDLRGQNGQAAPRLGRGAQQALAALEFLVSAECAEHDGERILGFLAHSWSGDGKGPPRDCSGNDFTSPRSAGASSGILRSSSGKGSAAAIFRGARLVAALHGSETRRFAASCFPAQMDSSGCGRHTRRVGWRLAGERASAACGGRRVSRQAGLFRAYWSVDKTLSFNSGGEIRCGQNEFLSDALPDLRGHSSRLSQLCEEEGGSRRSLAPCGRDLCVGNPHLDVPFPFCFGCRQPVSIGTGCEHGMLPFRSHVDVVRRARALHTPAMAADDHFVDTASGRTFARSACRPRFAFRRSAGHGVGSRF